MDRLVSLSVGVDDEKFTETFEDMLELTTKLAERHKYVSLSSTEPEESTTEEFAGENLYHDEDTIVKARMALARVLQNNGAWSQEELITIVHEMVSELQKDGILLRERMTS